MRYDMCYCTAPRRVAQPISEAVVCRMCLRMLDDADGRIVRIGERGAEITGERERQALERERHEAVHGR